MVEIPVKVCGDQWLDPEGFKAALWSVPPEVPITLDLRSEGPSLGALGILSELERFCSSTGRNSQSIHVIRNPNRIESFPYPRPDMVATFGASHFFKMSQNYWCDAKPTVDPSKIFALFIGRVSIARSAIMYDCFHEFSDQFLFSCMRTYNHYVWKSDRQGVNLEKIDDWISPANHQHWLHWWDNMPIPSLDGHDVQDQYEPGLNTNRDILSFYDRFSVELVCETFNIGETFFPTEKTVRPIVAGKPMIIYGPEKFLSRLRDMGFKTWHQIWDESYDDLQGPSRWQQIKQLITQILSLSDIERKHLIAQATEIAVYNHNHLKSMMPRL